MSSWVDRRWPHDSPADNWLVREVKGVVRLGWLAIPVIGIATLGDYLGWW